MAKRTLTLPKLMGQHSDNKKEAAEILTNSSVVVKQSYEHLKKQEKPRKKLNKEAGYA